MNLVLLQDAVTVFLGIFIEAIPFVLLGVIVSNLIKVYVKQGFLLRLIPRGKVAGTFAGTLIGFLFPVCECGNVPVARSLIAKGVAPHVAVTFLLAAPVLNPIVILATLAAFRGQPEVLWYRLGFTFLIAVTVGFLFSLARNPSDYVRPSVLAAAVSKEHVHGSKPQRFISGMVHEFFEMCSVLTIGALVASFSQALIPRSIITSIGSGPVSSVIAMTALAFVVSICSNIDAFFALSYTSNFTTGSIIAFLVFGPMIDIKGLFMLSAVFRIRGVFWIAILALQLTWLLTLFLNLNISSI